MKKIALRLIEVKIIVFCTLGKLLRKLLGSKHWIILERGYDARDNAYWFYRYVKEHHPQQRVYFIIDKASADYHKVQENALQIGSLKSYLLLGAAEKIVSTHYAVGFEKYIPNLFRFLGLYKKYYFLQHGVTKDDLVSLHGTVAPMRLFVCGAKPEANYVEHVFEHPLGVVRYTGFPRFDQLHNAASKRQILIMPTWRGYIREEKVFLESDYFCAWQGLLESDALIELLEKEDIQLVFYPHYEMQRFVDHFKSVSSHIAIAKFSDYDVQTLLKESALLITDYSSVFFDFAYMRKPVVYYQFDEDAFFGKHYQKGYFDYRDMGFGDVCTRESEVINSVIRICNNGIEPEQKYVDRIKGFFPLYDTKNCERIYDIIAGDRNEQ